MASREEPELTTERLATGPRSAEPEVETTLDEPAASAESAPSSPVALLDAAEADEYRGRWQAIQASFVDEPRDAVSQADRLVAEVMQRIAKSFAEHKDSLERQWGGGDEVSTEELRATLQHYRAFFNSLLK